jgi:hypothetical protein
VGKNWEVSTGAGIFCDVEVTQTEVAEHEGFEAETIEGSESGGPNVGVDLALKGGVVRIVCGK